jgi:primosomal protein N' (replication factor Y) (superfamily II helicase)
MSRTTLFVDVILPVAVPNLYTYRVPFELNDHIQIGQRVIVRFGKSKLYTALVRKIHEQIPAKYEAKYIESILDEQAIVNEKQFLLWEWIASYYMCTIGEVMNAALPSGLKLSSETKIVMNPLFNGHSLDLNDKEFLIMEALGLNNILTMEEAASISGQKSAYNIIKVMLQKGAVLLEEEIKEKYKPKKETYIRLSPEASEEENLKAIFEKLEKRAFKQLQVLMNFLHVSQHYSGERKEVKKSLLLKDEAASAGIIDQLVKKNIFELYDKETDRLTAAGDPSKEVSLSNEQNKVFENICSDFEKRDIALLHGITSSGKTEIYIRLIEKYISEGKQVLYLLPEIALTTQIINRLRKYFGKTVGVYHSKFSENERVEIWNNVNDSEKYKVVLGARSAMFLPFSDLGLVIVDEEHDTSFKQHDPAPRYNARDSAIYLANIHKAKTLLGSATPSIETSFNARSGKYGLHELFTRFGGVMMPEILLADIKEETRKKMIKSHFSTILLDHIKAALENKEQVILFQNRRGFSPLLECNICAWVPQCKNCDVSLTYHKGINMLRCHYCGFSIKPPQQCEACGDTNMQTKGFGTEKIEEELAIFFPEARISRMDLDTTRSKYAYHQLISDFEDHKVDVLVGTQMVTKGLDFGNVSLVGILNADSMLNFPDFRSFERSYQLMAQVSGRAGRKQKRGKVIIQTHNPSHFIIQCVLQNDYDTMYNTELADRKEFQYPPFYRLIEITVIHKDINLVNESAKSLTDYLRLNLGKRVLGPEFPLIARIKNQYYKTTLVKIEREAGLTKVKDVINKSLNNLKEEKLFKSIRIKINVDPL